MIPVPIIFGKRAMFIPHDGFAKRPPPGCSEIPAAEMREAVAGSLGMDKADEASPEFRTAMILVSPMFVRETAEEMARWSGYQVSECEHVIGLMTRSGLWRNGEPDRERYLQGGDKPGLSLGDVSLVMDTLLCLGAVKYLGDDRWCHSDVVIPARLPRRDGRIDEFAENLANGLSVKEAARLVGAGPHYGNAMLQRIRKRLGAQAV